MDPLRYGCLIMIVMIARYIFWVILLTCFVLLFKEIENSVREYNALKRRLNR
jgi:hypothetical protein